MGKGGRDYEGMTIPGSYRYPISVDRARNGVFGVNKLVLEVVHKVGGYVFRALWE